jgi:cyclopropane fatty-acyl-phospholipid synthase-like methyltransferase
MGIWQSLTGILKKETPVSISQATVPVEEPRPPIDPYPLSPYVAWAGRRNRDPILKVFKEIFPPSGRVLELATGSGAHINYFAPHFPGIQFQPSDYDTDVFETIKKTKAEKSNLNIADPIRIDLTDPATFPSAGDGRYDAIFVINIFQVAPVAIADGIANIGAKLLKDNGFIAIYGPFKVGGTYTTASNEAFDKEILAANVPEWGLKDVGDLEKAAAKHGIVLKKKLDLPANNFILIFGRG